MDVIDFMSDIEFKDSEEYREVYSHLVLVKSFNDSSNNGLFYVREKLPFFSQWSRNFIFHCVRKYKVVFVFDNEIVMGEPRLSHKIRDELSSLLSRIPEKSYRIGRTDGPDFKNCIRNADVDFCFYLSKTSKEILGSDKLMLDRSDMIIVNIIQKT